MESMDRFCSSCGAGISKVDQFCRKCGSDLGQGKPIKAKPAPESQDEESLSGSTAWFFLSVIGLLGWLLAGLSFITIAFISLPNAISTGGEFWATMNVLGSLLIGGTGVAAGIFCSRKLRRPEGHKDGQLYKFLFGREAERNYSILIWAAVLIPVALIFLQSYRSANGDMLRSEVFTPFIVFGVVYTVGLIILYRNVRMRQIRGGELRETDIETNKYGPNPRQAVSQQPYNPPSSIMKKIAKEISSW